MTNLTPCACRHHRLPEVVRHPQVQLVLVVVGEDEGEHRILHEVVEGSPSQLVQLHQVLKVGDLSLLPAEERRGENRSGKGLRQDKLQVPGPAGLRFRQRVALYQDEV